MLAKTLFSRFPSAIQDEVESFRKDFQEYSHGNTMRPLDLRPQTVWEAKHRVWWSRCSDCIALRGESGCWKAASHGEVPYVGGQECHEGLFSTIWITSGCWFVTSCCYLYLHLHVSSLKCLRTTELSLATWFATNIWQELLGLMGGQPWFLLPQKGERCVGHRTRLVTDHYCR